MKEPFIPYPVRFVGNNGDLPVSMVEHMQKGGMLYAVEAPARGRVFLSTHKNPVGHICTYVKEDAVVALG